DIAYSEPRNPRQTLDVYRPASGRNLPVVVWVHGGGWRAGDKTEIATKPAAFVRKGLIFISANYRFVTEVPMRQTANGCRFGLVRVASGRRMSRRFLAFPRLFSSPRACNL